VLVGCYSIDLYCTNAEEQKGCRVGWSHGGPPTYTGETEGECIRAARADGWVITNDRPRKTFCPACAKRRRNGKPSK
jgi:hypothetical protein